MATEPRPYPHPVIFTIVAPNTLFPSNYDHTRCNMGLNCFDPLRVAITFKAAESEWTQGFCAAHAADVMRAELK